MGGRRILGRKVDGGGPPTINDMLWWYNFDSASNLSLSGTDVLGGTNLQGVWNDLIGVNNPQYDSVNGCVTFNGTNNYLGANYAFPVVADNEAVWCVVVEFDSLVNVRNYIAVSGNGSNNYSSLRMRTTGPRIEHVSSRWYDIPNSVVQTMAGTVATSTKYLFYIQADGVDFKWYLNGVLLFTSTGATGWNRTGTLMGSFTMGGANLVSRQYAPCKVYESIAYLHAQSDTERADLFTYLNDKYTIY